MNFKICCFVTIKAILSALGFLFSKVPKNKLYLLNNSERVKK